MADRQAGEIPSEKQRQSNGYCRPLSSNPSFIRSLTSINQGLELIARAVSDLADDEVNRSQSSDLEPLRSARDGAICQAKGFKYAQLSTRINSHDYRSDELSSGLTLSPKVTRALAFSERDHLIVLREEFLGIDCAGAIRQTPDMGTDWMCLRTSLHAKPEGFASRASLPLMEQKGDARVCRWVIGPASTQRAIWDCIGVIFIMSDLLRGPLIVFGDAADFEWFFAADLTCAIFWTLDIVMSFRTGYVQRTRTVLEPRQIAIHYILRWFVVDIIIVCTDWVARVLQGVASVSMMRFARFNRVIRIVRLARAAKLHALLQSLDNILTSNYLLLVFSICKMSVVLFLVIHFLCCGWFFVGTFGEVASEKGWVRRSKLEEAVWYNQYFTAARWTLAQINGRTDVDEKMTTQEKMYTFGCGAFAVLFMGIFVGSLTSSMLDIQKLIRDKTKEMRILNRYLELHPVSRSTTFFIKKHLNDQQRLKYEEESEIEVLGILSMQLKMDLLYEVRVASLVFHPLFKEANRYFGRMMKQICVNAIRVVSAFAAEVIFEHSDRTSRMLLVDRGELRYVQGTSVRAQLEDWAIGGKETGFRLKEALLDEFKSRIGMAAKEASKQFAGVELYRSACIAEPALYCRWRHCGDLISISYSHLFAIEADSFYETASPSLDFVAWIAIYARCLVARLHRRQGSELSDLLEPEMDSLHHVLAFLSARPVTMPTLDGERVIADLDVQNPFDAEVFNAVDSCETRDEKPKKLKKSKKPKEDEIAETAEESAKADEAEKKLKNRKTQKSNKGTIQ